jgi:uncharacterized lipoprotein YehR (DUF1307 family)
VFNKKKHLAARALILLFVLWGCGNKENSKAPSYGFVSEFVD